MKVELAGVLWYVMLPFHLKIQVQTWVARSFVNIKRPCQRDVYVIKVTHSHSRFPLTATCELQ